MIPPEDRQGPEGHQSGIEQQDRPRNPDQEEDMAKEEYRQDKDDAHGQEQRQAERVQGQAGAQQHQPQDTARGEDRQGIADFRRPAGQGMHADGYRAADGGGDSAGH